MSYATYLHADGDITMSKASARTPDIYHYQWSRHLVINISYIETLRPALPAHNALISVSSKHEQAQLGLLPIFHDHRGTFGMRNPQLCPCHARLYVMWQICLLQFKQANIVIRAGGNLWLTWLLHEK